MRLPAASNTVLDVDWMVYLMPNIEQSDIWNLWKNSTNHPPPVLPPVLHRAMISKCSSARAMHYAVNTSVPYGPTSYTCNGFIFQDGRGVSQAFISSHDGTSMTLMLAENVRTDSVANVSNAHNWWDAPASPTSTNTANVRPNQLNFVGGDGDTAQYFADLADFQLLDADPPHPERLSSPTLLTPIPPTICTMPVPPTCTRWS